MVPSTEQGETWNLMDGAEQEKTWDIIRARRALYIPLKNKGGYGGKLITVKIPQMKRLRTKVHNYLLPIYQSTIFAKLK